jgi:hypothetical protein
MILGISWGSRRRPWNWERVVNDFVVVGRVGRRAVEISGEAGGRVCSVNGTSVGGSKDFCR